MDLWSVSARASDQWGYKEVHKDNISEKAREARLRWMGHVMRREEDNSLKKILMAKVVGKRSGGRQRLRWRDKVWRDMRDIGAAEGAWNDRARWKRLCRATDPTWRWTKGRKKKKIGYQCRIFSSNSCKNVGRQPATLVDIETSLPLREITGIF